MSDAPDLQEWVAVAGGYWLVDWVKWDAATAQFHFVRRQFFDGSHVRIKELSAAEVEEMQFRINIERSHYAVLAVARYLQSIGLVTDVPELRVRPKFADRKAYGDAGDIIVPGSGTVEVKRRRWHFMAREDIRFSSILLGRCGSHTESAFMIFITNDSATCAIVFKRESRPHWKHVQFVAKRYGVPIEHWECSLMHGDIVRLPREDE